MPSPSVLGGGDKNGNRELPPDPLAPSGPLRSAPPPPPTATESAPRSFLRPDSLPFSSALPAPPPAALSSPRAAWDARDPPARPYKARNRKRPPRGHGHRVAARRGALSPGAPAKLLLGAQGATGKAGLGWLPRWRLEQQRLGAPGDASQRLSPQALLVSVACARCLETLAAARAAGVPPHLWPGRTAPAKKGGEKKKGRSAINEVVTQEHTINIHKRIQGVGFKKGAPRAPKEIRKFAMKEMGTPDVCIDTRLNKAVWAKGIRDTPYQIHAQFSRKRNKDEDSPNKLYTLIQMHSWFVPDTNEESMWVGTTVGGHRHGSRLLRSDQELTNSSTTPLCQPPSPLPESRTTATMIIQGDTVNIGDVSYKLKAPKNPELVPQNYISESLAQSVVQHLRWIMQKDLLGQDVFLIGPPGPLRRSIAMQYLELTKREVEYIALSRDTTETDLKQRREIRSGTAFYIDQAIRAATEGRTLILEGLEKAERNVLPVLNNLLENREMQLEDGRFLMSAERYDKLLQDHTKMELDAWKIVRVSENFRVIALGLPVPRYSGNPLDPPLRSRFQARDIYYLPFKDQLNILYSIGANVSAEKVSQLLSFATTLCSQESSTLGLPDFPLDSLPAAVQILDSFPTMSIKHAIQWLYPYTILLGHEGRMAVEGVLKRFELQDPGSSLLPKEIVRVERMIENHFSQASVTIQIAEKEVIIKVPAGTRRLNQPCSSDRFIQTLSHKQLLAEMMQSHMVKDLCLIGGRGCGKTVVAKNFADILGYNIEPIMLYQLREDSDEENKENQGEETKVSRHLNFGTNPTSITYEDAQRTLNHQMAKKQKWPVQQLRIRLLPRLSRPGLSKCRLTISTIIQFSHPTGSEYEVPAVKNERKIGAENLKCLPFAH
ncbi:hypothetical protein TREES_T100021607 [Tupaia chinensis]|uniref:Large ribosomal subunit protein eL31 n=1 Tax=Tupaia chinensis TaxID=246437 RepID=L9K455_TUPCH|nr:hypothetical protein TREES_T100021607 [Tupaia chinensis]